MLAIFAFLILCFFIAAWVTSVGALLFLTLSMILETLNDRSDYS